MADTAPIYLSPPEACVYLEKEYGIKRTTGTLAKVRCLGLDGPKFHRAGSRIVYPVPELDRWARRQLGELLSRTPERLATEPEHAAA